MLVITGGGGFIGSVLAAQLNEAGRSDLVLVDRFGTGDKWRNIAKRDFDEIMPPDALFDWLDRFGDAVESVFHLGAISETTFADADEMIRNNLNYSIALWRWCAARRKKFIYASSAATYGTAQPGSTMRAHRIAENSAAAQSLRLVETRFRSVGDAAGSNRKRAAALGRAQILQRVRAERVPQRRNDEPRGEELSSHHGRR